MSHCISPEYATPRPILPIGASVCAAFSQDKTAVNDKITRVATLLDEFRSITAALNREGIDYAVCGGWALAIHGLLRATVDIDLLVLAEDLEKAFNVARSCGYNVEGLPLSFDNGAFELRRISKVDQDSRELITVDFLLVTEVYKDVWATKELTISEFGPMKVVSKAGLIKMKMLAGRDKDLLDIKELEANDSEN